MTNYRGMAVLFITRYIALIGKLYTISSLQGLPIDAIPSVAIYKSLLHCQSCECYQMFIEKEANVRKATKRSE